MPSAAGTGESEHYFAAIIIIRLLCDDFDFRHFAKEKAASSGIISAFEIDEAILISPFHFAAMPPP